MNITLPPWARAIQQSWWFQLLVVPVLIAAVTAFIKCAGSDLSNVSLLCLITGVDAAKAQVLALIGLYLIAMIQHSPGSSTFNSNGTINKQVQEVVDADKAGKPVAVIPVSSPAVREEVRTIVDSKGGITASPPVLDIHSVQKVAETLKS